MSTKLRAVSEGDRASWSARLGERLLPVVAALPAGQAVAVFGGIKTEPDLLPLVRALWEKDVPVVLFAMEGTVLVPFLIHSEKDILSGQMGVWEPARSEEKRVQLERLGAILVPALVFAKEDGARLGRGAGFYDRLLCRQEVSARRIGVGFAIQMQKSLPELAHEPHDVHMQNLVSEEGWWDVEG